MTVSFEEMMPRGEESRQLGTSIFLILTSIIFISLALILCTYKSMLTVQALKIESTYVGHVIHPNSMTPVNGSF